MSHKLVMKKKRFSEYWSFMAITLISKQLAEQSNSQLDLKSAIQLLSSSIDVLFKNIEQHDQQIAREINQNYIA